MASDKTLAEDETTCKDADKFAKLFYDALDRKRSKMNFLYVDESTLVWNGNPVCGVENITKFLEALPQTTHNIVSMDAHAINGPNAQQCIVVLSVGNVNIGGTTHAFSQTLILVIDDEKYKIKSDRFRFID
ncbi:hypothetical protein AB6A40_009610 [Gnathostoma spinigerum]|uniref:NTF2-related export protein n=1 Tax=Gnathostoma spinigerum TaxID=75299 RepID=A0ABD6EZF6_9BILA